MPLTILSVSYPLARVSPSTAGGAEQILLTLDRELVRMGNSSIVLAPAGSRCAGLLVSAQVASGTLDESARQAAQHAFRKLTSQILERYPVDIVHMHGLDFCEYLPETDIPIVVTLHLPLRWYRPEAWSRRRLGTTLVCVSHTQARTALPHMQIDRVIRNGIEVGQFAPGRKGDYALVMSRICPEKGIHLALQAADRAQTRLIIAGDLFPYPEHVRYFKEEIHPRLRDGAHFVGPVGGVRKAQLLAGAKCLLIPSLAPETNSLVAMEAMACGTPVIAFRNGALAEIVRDRITGLLVSTVEEMSDAIQRAQTINPVECRTFAEQEFSAKKMVLSYVELYRTLCAAQTAPELQAA